MHGNKLAAFKFSALSSMEKGKNVSLLISKWWQSSLSVEKAENDNRLTHSVQKAWWMLNVWNMSIPHSFISTELYQNWKKKIQMRSKSTFVHLLIGVTIMWECLWLCWNAQIFNCSSIPSLTSQEIKVRREALQNKLEK